MLIGQSAGAGTCMSFGWSAGVGRQVCQFANGWGGYAGMLVS